MWEIKKEMFVKYEKYETTRNLSNYDRWDASAIKKRADFLIDRLLKKWFTADEVSAASSAAEVSALGAGTEADETDDQAAEEEQQVTLFLTAGRVMPGARQPSDVGAVHARWTKTRSDAFKNAELYEHVLVDPKGRTAAGLVRFVRDTFSFAPSLLNSAKGREQLRQQLAERARLLVGGTAPVKLPRFEDSSKLERLLKALLAPPPAEVGIADSTAAEMPAAAQQQQPGQKRKMQQGGGQAAGAKRKQPLPSEQLLAAGQAAAAAGLAGESDAALKQQARKLPQGTAAQEKQSAVVEQQRDGQAPTKETANKQESKQVPGKQQQPVIDKEKQAAVADEREKGQKGMQQ